MRRRPPTTPRLPAAPTPARFARRPAARQPAARRPSTRQPSTRRPSTRQPAARQLVPLLCALFLAVGLVPAAPAAAHGGKIKLAVAGDGATGVTVQASYQDGHPVDNGVRLVLTATAEGGRTVGPLQLNPAGEGEGFYSTGPVLTPGPWQVTVTAPKPNPAEVRVVVQARAAQGAPPAPTPGAAGAPDPAGTTTWLWWVAGAAVALAAIATVGALLVRTRRRA